MNEAASTARTPGPDSVAKKIAAPACGQWFKDEIKSLMD
jgi:hypothetical protein